MACVVLHQCCLCHFNEPSCADTACILMHSALPYLVIRATHPPPTGVVRRHLRRVTDDAVASVTIDSAVGALAAAGLSSDGPLGAAAGGLYSVSSLTGRGGLGAGSGAGLLQPASSLGGLGLGAASASASPLGALPLLASELRSLADGLAPLALAPAGLLVRKGVVDVFAAICDAVRAAVQKAADSAKVGAACSCVCVCARSCACVGVGVGGWVDGCLAAGVCDEG